MGKFIAKLEVSKLFFHACFPILLLAVAGHILHLCMIRLQSDCIFIM